MQKRLIKSLIELEGSAWRWHCLISSTLSKNLPTWKPSPTRSFSETSSGFSPGSSQRRSDALNSSLLR